MTALLRTPATAVWAVLVLATIATWTLGTQHGIHTHTLASVVILLIAFIKVRLVGLYFMELKAAPVLLRAPFEVYCVVLLALLSGMYLVG